MDLCQQTDVSLFNVLSRFVIHFLPRSKYLLISWLQSPCTVIMKLNKIHYCFRFSPLPLTALHFSAICKASSDNHFAFLHFFSLGMVLIPVSCTMSQTSVHSSSGTLSVRSNPLDMSHFHYIIIRDLI